MCVPTVEITYVFSVVERKVVQCREDEEDRKATKISTFVLDIISHSCVFLANSGECDDSRLLVKRCGP